jgi:hypothetical protein
MQKATDWLVRNKVDRWLNRILDLADKTAAKTRPAESQRHAASSDCSRCKAKHDSTRAGLPAWIHVGISCWLLAWPGLLHLLHHVSNTRKSSCQVLLSQAKVGPLVVQVQLLPKLQLP